MKFVGDAMHTFYVLTIKICEHVTHVSGTIASNNHQLIKETKIDQLIEKNDFRQR